MTEEEENKLLYMLARHDEAYFFSPTGPWWKRWIPGLCRHEKVRCTHGDEIIGRHFRRRVCMICGIALRGPLPKLCFFTGESHESG